MKSYSDKRVKIESRDHLDHVVGVTGICDIDDFISSEIVKHITDGAYISFGYDFDLDKTDWMYDYDDLDEDTIRQDVEFIPMP